ncbi:MAG: GAF domain-containing protein [Nitrospirae bacterium]|nr:GAF domain-containing protein [Nitrospirota bacterium]
MGGHVRCDFGSDFDPRQGFQPFNLVRVNRALANRPGVEPRDLIGKKCFQILCGREEPLDDCPDVRTMRSHLPESLEKEQTVLGGVFQVSTYPLVTHDGNFWGTVHVARDVTELKKVDERIRKEAEISSSLLQVSEALTASLDLPTLFSKVTEISCRMIGADHSAVFLWSGEEQAFIPQAVQGLPGELLPEFRARRFRPLDFPCFGDILRTGGPVSIPDCSRSDLISPEFAGHFRLGSLHVTPIMRRGEVIGALQVGQTEGPREWTSKEVDLINGITHQLAVMIDNARLYRQMVEKSLELSRHLETMTVMHEIDLAVLSKLDQEEILEEVTHRVRRLVPADRVTLVTVDPERECFRYVAGFGIDVPKGEEVPFHETDAAEVVRRRTAIVRPDLSHEPDLLRLDRMFYDHGFRSDIRIPLFQKEEVSALLNVGSFRPGAFTKEDLSVLENVSAQISVALEHVRLVRELQDALLSITLSLASAIEAKSPWTRGHSDRVTRYALEIASRLGFSDEEKETLRLAGLLHDIGKIGTYEAILEKPDRLTPEEMEVVKQHSMKGVEILKPIRGLEPILPLVAHHHENYDGSGYPAGLKGDAIPLAARILTVADAYDSMTADRPYRPAPGRDFAVAELQRCAGSQFDPEVVRTFLHVAQ